MPKRNFDIEKVIKEQRAFAKERDWDQFHTPKNLSMALAAEAAELLEIFQWLNEDQSKRVMEDPKKATAVRHELADIMFYLVRIADILDVDLDAAFWEKLEHNKKKYPVEKSRGSAKKYSEW